MKKPKPDHPSDDGWSFFQIARSASSIVGSPHCFAVAVGLVLIWLVTGPFFHFSDTWQLVINTGTTIVTFLMVFLIQNTQNRDAMAIHLKLDELLRSIKSASNRMIDLEDCTDQELEKIAGEFKNLRDAAELKLKSRRETVKQSRPVHRS
jgi:low affinity Fe/Cu permease